MVYIGREKERDQDLRGVWLDFFLHREVRGVCFLSGCSRGDRKFLQISRTQNLQPKVGENSDRRGPHGSDQIRVLGHAEGKLQSGPSRGENGPCR
jgi:hypothetical protein